MNDRSKLENSLKVILQQLKSFRSTIPSDSVFAELRDSINYVILQSKKCLKVTDSSLVKCKREISTPCSDIDSPHIPKDFCSLSLPHDHFYSGLLPDDLDGKDIQKLQDREIDEIVFKLKQNELNRNFVRSGKKTSLHYAAYWGSQTCVQTLILQGSDLTARDEYGLTPIIWACRSDRLGNLVILLKAAKIRSIPEKQWMYDSSGYHLIHHTLLKDDRLKCLEYLSNSEYGLNVDSEGQNALHHAAMKGFSNGCKIILQYKPNAILLNQFNSENRTPLHLATINGHGNIVNLLLSHKANPYLHDKNNCSAYQYANMKRLYFCLLIYERYNVGKEKQQDEKHSLNENLINELTSFRPVNPQFSHYQDFYLNAHQHSDSQTKSPSSSIPDTRPVALVNDKQINQSTKQAHDSSSPLNDSLRKKLTNNLLVESNNDNNIVNKNIYSTQNHVSPRITPKGQLTEIKSMISSRDIQNNKVKNNFKIKRELLPTDKRVHRNGNSTVPSKRISQQIDKLQNPTLKIRNSIQSSSSDHSDVDSKRNDEHNEALKSRPYNNHGVSNNSNVMNATYNKGKINSKDVDKLKNADSSSVSDINSIPDTERNPMPTPRKTPYTSEINQSSWKSVLYHSRLLKRDQVNNMPQQNSMNNNHKISMNKSNSIHLEYEDEIIPLNMKLFTKSTVNSSYLNKTLLCNNNNNNNLLSPSLNSVHRKIINVNKK
ncbi:unnamed protein product [Schistosoma rodhaini]|uniref:Uncharacterized protein n=1 Tax=Schistosoma rodhaini TaxID=6188 RepID=A0AA85FUH0_9TREM|nr:unnamed protein product [Schistosoma rodhaini]